MYDGEKLCEEDVIKDSPPILSWWIL